VCNIGLAVSWRSICFHHRLVIMLWTLRQVCTERGLPIGKQVVIIWWDVYTVHSCEEICDWLEAKYPYIRVVFLPGGRATGSTGG
jgi:hypothetical protein